MTRKVPDAADSRIARIDEPGMCVNTCVIARRRVLSAATAGTAVLYAVVDVVASNHPSAVAWRWTGPATAVIVLVATHWWPVRRPPVRKHVILRVLGFLGGWAAGVVGLLCLIAAVFISSPTWVGLPVLIAAFALGYGWIAEIATFWMLAGLIAPPVVEHAVEIYAGVRAAQELPQDIRDLRRIHARSRGRRNTQGPPGNPPAAP